MAADGREHARAAGLRYVRCDGPGIRRRRAGKGWTYRTDDGRRVTDAATLERIRKLAIPPAWTDVWICPDPRGHLQATGRDAKGRRQYRYHPDFRKARDGHKYDRMVQFARALPRIRERVDADLARKGLPREKVLAAMVRLLETTAMRPGSAEYAKTNESRGLTTLEDGHARFLGDEVRFRFKGKSGVEHEVTIRDPELAEIVRDCRDLPGEELFQYLDEDGEARVVTSGDLNDYVREASGKDFTAKDFRTWTGTVLAALELAHHGVPRSEAQAKRRIARAIRRVAEALGNTPAVARSAYVHPGVLEAYRHGWLPETFLHEAARAPAGAPLDAAERGAQRVLRHAES